MPDKDDSYYADSYSEDRELIFFEAGSLSADAVIEGRRLATCEMGRNVRPSRRHPEGLADCECPAIAKILWSNGEESPVCREHYEEIRNDTMRMADTVDSIEACEAKRASI